MDKIALPENGSLIRFKRFDEDEWKEGEYDEQNKMFIEIYSAETVTHNSTDITEWNYMEEV